MFLNTLFHGHIQTRSPHVHFTPTHIIHYTYLVCSASSIKEADLPEAYIMKMCPNFSSYFSFHSTSNCKTGSDADLTALPCSSTLIFANGSAVTEGTLPILGCAAKASNHPVTGVWFHHCRLESSMTWSTLGHGDGIVAAANADA